ncbi:MAG: M23 family metallopeptidase [Anaerolineales bacterium]|nr:M23 family metallopeptidase [Anaerolineales bacterium]
MRIINAALRIIPFFLLPSFFSLLLAACTAPAPTLVPEAPVVEPSPMPLLAQVQATANAAVARYVVTPVSPSPTPEFIVPTLVPDFLQLVVPTLNAEDPRRQVFPTPIVLATPEGWRPPMQSVPLAIRPQDHFWFTRPIASDNVNYPLGTYRYGTDYFGQMNIHAGIDIDAPRGTPILAAGSGQIIWVGWGLFNFDPRRTDDPYGIAVAIRHDFGYKGQALYTLYAHMEAANSFFLGQRVRTGDILGWVGSTGNSTGPHVHFEVRVGQNDYYQTRNPELWIAPYTGWGVLAGQVLDKAGRYAYSVPIEIYDANNRLLYTVYTYGDRVARPDDEWRENFAISDLPAGRYRLKATLGLILPEIEAPPALPTTDPGGVEGAAVAPPPTAFPPLPRPVPGGEIKIMEGFVDVLPGQTTFVILKEDVGLITNAMPAQTATPPYPTLTFTPSPTATPTFTPTATRTPRPTLTPWPTRTPIPGATPRPTRTP